MYNFYFCCIYIFNTNLHQHTSEHSTLESMPEQLSPPPYTRRLAHCDVSFMGRILLHLMVQSSNHFYSPLFLSLE